MPSGQKGCVVKKTILLADDDREMCLEMEEMLKNENYEVKSVHDGRTAIKLIKKVRFDLLLLDIKLPRMNGFEVLRELSKMKSGIKVIVVTGTITSAILPVYKGITPRDGAALLKTADLVVNKPFDIQKLTEKIAQYIS